ncbi:MAG: MopE-related protein [Myxococcota bacterium]|nr:MopE-related protein [Myxococcota bacterium]
MMRTSFCLIALLLIGCKPDGISDGPLMSISAESLDFGEVPVDTTASLSFTIDNQGSTEFEVLSVSIIEGRTAVWSVNGENSVLLESGESLEVEVAFAPYELTREEGRIQVRTTFEDEPSRYVILDGIGGLSIEDLDEDGFSPAEGDCDDGRDTVYPDAEEICDGRDNDCDDELGEDEVDEDYDGYLLCSGDCDDLNEAIYPGAEEICDDEDTDCDGVIQDRLDADSDGYSLCSGDCDDTTAVASPGNPELCDLIDNNCSGDVDDIDIDGDGFSPCDNGGDCDDNDYFAYPVIVDQSAKNGGDGTWDEPYASIAEALAGIDGVCRTVVLSQDTYEVSRTWSDGELTLVGAGDGPEAVKLTLGKDADGPIFAVSSNAHLILRNVTLYNSVSDVDGAALRADAADITLDGVVLSNNNCTDCDGGAVAVSSGTLTMENCTLIDNKSGDDGGAVAVSFGTLIDDGSLYEDNAGDRGGAIRAESSTVEMTDVTLLSNTAVTEGGGISLAGGSDHLIERVTVWSNSAQLYGGGIAVAGLEDSGSILRNLYVQDNVAGTAGGGVSVIGDAASFLLANSTIVANKSDDDGAGIYVEVDDASGLSIWSNIVYYNNGESGLYVSDGSGASVAYNTAFSTTSSINFSLGEGEDVGENEERDPTFGSFSNDGEPAKDDLTLASGSSEIGSGPQTGEGPSGYVWTDADNSRNDRGATGGQGG